MPTLENLFGYSLMMFAFDNAKHNRAHFHVFKDGNNLASIDIYSCKIIVGNLDNKFYKKLRIWHNSHKDFLINNWELLSQGKPPIKKDK